MSTEIIIPKIAPTPIGTIKIRRQDLIARRDMGKIVIGYYEIYDAAIPVVVFGPTISALAPTATAIEDPSVLYLYDIDTDILTPVGGPGNPFYIEVTYLEALELVGDSDLEPGATYFITDRNILVQAASTDAFSLHASYKAFNADYQFAGDYSDVTGFVNTVGVFYPSMPTGPGDVEIGSVCIYNNLHYINLTGLVGMAPGSDPEWELIPVSITGGYIIEWDNIEWDFESDWIQKRVDRRGNSISYSLLTDSNYFGLGYSAVSIFQWGRDGNYGNTCVESYISCLNQPCKIQNNTLTSLCYIDSIITTAISSGPVISGNVLTRGSSINGVTIGSESQIVGNNILNGSYISSVSIGDSASIASNHMSASNVLSGITFNGGQIQNNIFDPGAEMKDMEIDGVADITNNRLGNLASIKDIEGENITVISFNTLGVSASIKDLVMASTATINYNTIGTLSSLSNKTFLFGIAFTNCVINVPINLTETISVAINDKRIDKGFSNFVCVLDLDDLAIFNDGAPGILTIPTYLNYMGVFNLLRAGSAAADVYRIVNAPLNHEFELRSTNCALTVTGNPISGGGATDVVLSVAAIVTATNRDFVRLRKVTSSGIFEVNHKLYI